MAGHGAELDGEHYLLAKEMVPIDKPERLKTRAIHQQEVLATLYHKLGIALDATTVTDNQGRPQYLLDRRTPIAELI